VNRHVYGVGSFGLWNAIITASSCLVAFRLQPVWKAVTDSVVICLQYGINDGFPEGKRRRDEWWGVVAGPVRSHRSQVTQVMGLVVQTYPRFVPRPWGASG